MYKHILVAVDGSEHSLRATNEAANIASLSNDCTVELLLVADFSKVKSEVLHSKGKKDLNRLRQKRLQPAINKLKEKNISYTTKILHGDPGPMIVDYVNKGHFNLCVIGSRGLNMLQEMVLGSVSHKVAKRAECPVLIVK